MEQGLDSHPSEPSILITRTWNRQAVSGDIDIRLWNPRKLPADWTNFGHNTFKLEKEMLDKKGKTGF